MLAWQTIKLVWATTKLMWRFKKTTSVLIAAILLDVWSPAYYWAEGLYYESRDEPFLGKIAVTNVIFNRVRNRGNGFSNNVEKVVHKKRFDARRKIWICQFSYYCDGKADNPWKHHYSQWCKWVGIKIMSWPMLVYGYSHIDITGGALYYKRFDFNSSWFNDMVKKGKMVPTRRFGAHQFYR